LYIYTREFVELVRRLNQLTRGKMHAFSDFRDVLAREMSSALPEVAEDVRMVVERTGGEVDVVEEAGGRNGNGNGNGNHAAGGGQYR
jgi:mediator of RNA polymerase II transcription subunit 10